MDTTAAPVPNRKVVRTSVAMVGACVMQEGKKSREKCLVNVNSFIAKGEKKK